MTDFRLNFSSIMNDMKNLKEKFGKRMKEMRKAKKLTQEHLAELVGIEPQNLSKIECGMHFPQPDKIEKNSFCFWFRNF